MSNNLLVIQDITYEAARILKGKLGLTNLVNKSYDERFARSGAKVGDTTQARLPVQFRNSTGAALDVQGLNEASKTVQLTTQYQRSFAYSSKDRALSMDDYSPRYIAPAIASMAAQIDGDGFKMALASANGLVGTVGGGFTSAAQAQRVVGEARARITNAGSSGDLVIVGSPDFTVEAASQYTNVFNAGTEGRDEFRTGLVSTVGGFDWYENTQIGTFGGSTFSGSPVVSASTASTVTISGFSGSVTLLAGTVLEIDGVYAVNPMSKYSTGKLKQFSVLTDVTGSGSVTVTLSEAIVATGERQNVTAAPAASAKVNFPGQTSGASTSKIALAFDKDAFVFANADLDFPTSGAESHREYIPELGLSIRAVTQYNINTDSTVLRLDVLGGWAPLYNHLAVKIAA